MKHIKAILIALVLWIVLAAPAADVVPPTTAFTRYLLTSTNQSQFQTRAGIDTNNAGTTYNLSASTNLPFTGLDAAARTTVTNAATKAAQDATNPIPATVATIPARTAYELTASTNIPSRSLNRDAAGKVPQFLMSSYNVFGTVEATIAATNTGIEQPNFMRWATNSIQWWATNGMRSAGHVAIQFDDGWQGYRTNGVLTWSTNVLPMGVPAVAQMAHTNGLKLYLYSAYTTNACNPLAVSSPIDKVYADVQTMMSWGVDGCKFDTCDSTNWAASNIDVYRNYIIQYARTANQAIDDYNSRVLATNGAVRSFWIWIPTTIQAPDPNIGTISQELVALANVVIMNWPDPSYGIHGDPYLTNTIKLAKLSIAARDVVGRGCYPHMESFYAQGLHNPGGSAFGIGAWTNFLNLYAAVCSPRAGTFGMWDVGTITNANGATYPSENAGTPIPLMRVSGQYWTNANFLEIYRDPAGIISRVISSNNLCEAWVRPLGHDYSDTVALTLINARWTNGSSQPITVNVTDFGGNPNKTYVAREVWTGTETTFTTSLTVTVAPYTTMLFKIYPQATADVATSVRIERGTFPFTALRVTGTGAGKTTSGGSPYFQREGFEQAAANNAAYIDIPAPAWATNAILRYNNYSGASTTVAWTNEVYVDVYAPGTRLQYGPSSGAPYGTTRETVIVNSGATTWVTNNIPLNPTNCPKWILLQINPSTNASSRFTLGPIDYEFR